MLKNKYAIFAITLTLGLFLWGGASASDKPMVWRFLDDSPSRTHPLFAKVSVPFAQAVTERSQGRLKIEVHLASELGYKGDEELRVLEAGAVEMGHIHCGWVAGDLPILGVFNLPTIFAKPEDVVKGYTATKDIWKRKLAERRVIPIGCAMVDEQITYSKKPVKTLKDFKGLKIRAYYAELSDLMSALGASPVFIPFPEQYSALQRGVIDATITGAGVGVALKFWEVTRYVMVDVAYAYAPHIIGVSMKHFEGLPDDLKKIVLDEGEKMGIRAASLMDKIGKDAQANLAKKGTEISNVSSGDRAKIVKIAEDKVWIKWVDRTGPIGKELLEKILNATK
jgi:TRAP-type C4-dicarboxylate transport system substrate-binding protein